MTITSIDTGRPLKLDTASCHLTTAQIVGVRHGRHTNDLSVLDHMFKLAGYPVGSEDWTQAHAAAAQAWACTCEKRAREQASDWRDGPYCGRSLRQGARKPRTAMLLS